MCRYYEAGFAPRSWSQKSNCKKTPAFLSYEHKSLQEFGVSKFVTKRLETAENMQVSLDLYKNQ